MYYKGTLGQLGLQVEERHDTTYSLRPELSPCYRKFCHDVNQSQNFVNT